MSFVLMLTICDGFLAAWGLAMAWQRVALRQLSLAKRTSRGFTLVELLVVVAIIALLAAILFPVFGTAREKARQASCMSNQKQLGLAALQYSQDNDEMCVSSLVHNGRGWAGCIWPYVKATGVYTCPDDPTLTSPGTVEFSYAANSNLVYFIEIGQGAVPLAKVTNPSVTVMFTEAQGATWPMTGGTLSGETNSLSGDVGTGDAAHGSLPFPYTLWECGYLGNPAKTAAQVPLIDANNPTGRHLNGSIYAFADGHAKWLTSRSVSPGNQPRTTGCVQDSPSGTCYWIASDGNAASTDELSASGFAATFSGI